MKLDPDELKKEITRISKELKTQDNLATAHPVFVVFDYRGERSRKTRYKPGFIGAHFTRVAAESYIKMKIEEKES